MVFAYQSWVMNLTFHTTLWYCIHTHYYMVTSGDLLEVFHPHMSYLSNNGCKFRQPTPKHFFLGFFTACLHAPRGDAKLQATHTLFVTASRKYSYSLTHFPSVCGFVFHHSCHPRYKHNKLLPY